VRRAWPRGSPVALTHGPTYNDAYISRVALPFASRMVLQRSMSFRFSCCFGAAFALTGCPAPKPFPPLPDALVFDCPEACDDCDIPEECEALGLSAPLAVGATWTLEPGVLGVDVYDVTTTRFGTPNPEPVVVGNVDVLTLVGELELRADGAGITAVLLQNDEGRVQDLVHVRVASADALLVTTAEESDDPSLPLTVAVGDVLSLRVKPMRGGRELGGRVVATWSVVPAPGENAPVSLEVVSTDPTLVRVIGLGSGSAVVRASFGDAAGEREVLVP
jgi:hypothetical protein